MAALCLPASIEQSAFRGHHYPNILARGGGVRAPVGPCPNASHPTRTPHIWGERCELAQIHGDKATACAALRRSEPGARPRSSSPALTSGFAVANAAGMPTWSCAATTWFRHMPSRVAARHARSLARRGNRMTLPRKAVAGIRRQRTLSLGGHCLGGVAKNTKHRPRPVSLPQLRWLKERKP
jgi:hypothetical protein